MTLSYFVDICPGQEEIDFVVISEKIELFATSYSSNLLLSSVRVFSRLNLPESIYNAAFGYQELTWACISFTVCLINAVLTLTRRKGGTVSAA